jgi:DNA-binding CsgD family transcriptional regulator
VSRPLAVLLALGLGLGNAGLAHLLRRGPCSQQLQRVRWLATGLEWMVGLGIISLCSHDPNSQAPAVLLALVLTTGLRFGGHGLVAAAIGAGLVLGVAVGVQVLILGVLDAAAATGALAIWGALILLFALVVASMVRAVADWHQWTEARGERDHAALPLSLSARELELLPLLTRNELAYEQIARELAISTGTVKTHVQRMGKKLKVTGRQAVVLAAREQGLVPPVQEPPSTEG